MILLTSEKILNHIEISHFNIAYKIIKENKNYEYDVLINKNLTLGTIRKWFDNLAEVFSKPMPEGGYQVMSTSAKKKRKHKKANHKDQEHKED